MFHIIKEQLYQSLLDIVLNRTHLLERVLRESSIKEKIASDPKLINALIDDHEQLKSLLIHPKSKRRFSQDKNFLFRLMRNETERQALVPDRSILNNATFLEGNVLGNLAANPSALEAILSSETAALKLLNNEKIFQQISSNTSIRRKILSDERTIERLLSDTKLLTKVLNDDAMLFALLAQESIVEKLARNSHFISILFSNRKVLKSVAAQDKILNILVADRTILKELLGRDPVLERLANNKIFLEKLFSSDRALNKILTSQKIGSTGKGSWLFNKTLVFIHGFSECAIDEYGLVRIRGWALSNKTIDAVRIHVNEGFLDDAEINCPRSDILEQYPEFKNSQSGFSFMRQVHGADPFNTSLRIQFISGNTTIKEEVRRLKFLSVCERSPGETLEFEGTNTLDPDHRKLVVLVTHLQLLPSNQGNRIVILDLLRWLRKNNFRIFLLVQCKFETIQSNLDDLRNLVDKVFVTEFKPQKQTLRRKRPIVDRYSSFTEECLLKIHKEHGIFAVVAEYIHMASCLEMLPNSVLKIIQTIDVFSRIKEQRASHDLDIAERLVCDEDEEKKLLEQAHTIIAIQEHERTLLQQMVPHRKVITLGLSKEAFPDSHFLSSSLAHVCFFGSNNPPNLMGIQDFIKYSWPSILISAPHARLRISGTICRELENKFIDRDWKSEGIDLLGVLEDLGPEFDSAQVVINCVPLGTGLKVKSIEALCRGKALVSTASGVEGIQYQDSPPFRVAEDWKNFSTQVVDLLKDPKKRENLEKKARDYQDQFLTDEKVYSEFQEVLGKWQTTSFELEQGDDPKIQNYIFTLLEQLHRTRISGRLAVLMTSDVLFSKYTVKWLTMHSLNLCGLFSENERLIDKQCFGLRISPLTRINSNNFDCCLIPSFDLNEVNQLEEKCNENGVESFTFFVRSPFKDRFRLEELRGKHLGERAFIIGNGPSVRFEDLDKLQGELVFGANRFHLAYDKTSLRPQYTAMGDILMVEQHGAEVAKNCGGTLFLLARAAHHIIWPEESDVVLYDILPRPRGPFPQVAFSEDISAGLGNAGSTIYDLIQIAVWTGVKTIYLYGMDHNFQIPQEHSIRGGMAVTHQGEENHFLKHYRAPGEKWYTPITSVIEKGFQVARDNCEQRGVEIFNVTRGGRLEIFKRKSFDRVV